MRICRRDALQWAKELIRIRSINPPGRELEAADFCAGRLRDMGCHAALDRFDEGRANVSAHWGNRDDTALIFNGHLDVVPAQGVWKHSPFSAAVEDGLLHGRGSADMKSGIAAIMAAVKALTLTDIIPARGLQILFVSDEEAANKGLLRVLEQRSVKADGCVIAEPTGLRVHLGNRGYSSFYLDAAGTACHACRPEEGKNAIYVMAEAIRRIERWGQELRGRAHPLLGPMSLSVGVIRGGFAPNTVPDNCQIEMEIRVLPGIDLADITAQVHELVGDLAAVRVRSWTPASLAPKDGALAQSALFHAARVTGVESGPAAFPACTEAGFFSENLGIPTILLGPGDIARAHRQDEFVPICEIEQAVDIYTGIALDYVYNSK